MSDNPRVWVTDNGPSLGHADPRFLPTIPREHVQTMTLPDVSRTLKEQDARIRTLEAELLRVRTTGHAAAHELDNIAIELGLGHSPKPGIVAEEVRKLAQAREDARVLAEWVRDAIGPGDLDGLPFVYDDLHVALERNKP